MITDNIAYATVEIFDDHIVRVNDQHEKIYISRSMRNRQIKSDSQEKDKNVYFFKETDDELILCEETYEDKHVKPLISCSKELTNEGWEHFFSTFDMSNSTEVRVYNAMRQRLEEDPTLTIESFFDFESRYELISFIIYHNTQVILPNTELPMSIKVTQKPSAWEMVKRF